MRGRNLDVNIITIVDKLCGKRNDKRCSVIGYMNIARHFDYFIDKLDNLFDFYFDLMTRRGASQRCVFGFIDLLEAYKNVILMLRFFKEGMKSGKSNIVATARKYLKKYKEFREKKQAKLNRECLSSPVRETGYLTGTEKLSFIPILFSTKGIGIKMLEESEKVADEIFNSFQSIPSNYLEETLDALVYYYSTIIGMVAYSTVVRNHNNWHSYSSDFFKEIETYIDWSIRLRKKLRKTPQTRRLIKYVDMTDNILRVFLKPHARMIGTTLKGDRFIANKIAKFCGIRIVGHSSGWTTFTFR